MTRDPLWLAPLLRGLGGLALFVILAVAVRYQLKEGQSNEPFDSGVD